jgi:hypothetical protein
MSQFPGTDVPRCDASLEQVAATLSTRTTLVAAAIALWFAAAISPDWIPTSDSALYLMLGRSLAHGEGYALYGKPHLWVPPGYPMLVAALDRAGLGSMVCLNTAMAILGLLSVWMSYRLLLQLAPKPVAILCAGLVGLNAALHMVSARQLSDIPFTLLVLSGLVALHRGLRGERWMLELGMVTLLASCWVRLTGLALVAGCATGLLFQPRCASRRRVICNLLALLLVVVGCLGLFGARYTNQLHANGSVPPASYLSCLAPAFSQPVHFWLSGPLSNAYQSAEDVSRYLIGQNMHPTVALFVLVLPMLIGFWRRIVRGEYLTSAAAAAYLAGVVLILPASDRYLLPIAPLITLYFLEGLAALFERLPRIRPFAGRLLLGLVVLLVIFNGVKGVGGLRRNRDTIALRHAELDEPVRLLRSEVRAGEQFLSSEKERELAYLSGLPFVQFDRGAVVPRMVPDEYLRYLFREGVRVVVLAPERVAAMPDTRILQGAVDDSRMFTFIGQSGRFRLYRYHTPPAVLVSAASSEARPAAR